MHKVTPVTTVSLNYSPFNLSYFDYSFKIELRVSLGRMAATAFSSSSK